MRTNAGRQSPTLLHKYVAFNYVPPQPTKIYWGTCQAEGTRKRALLYFRPVTRSPRMTLEGLKREEGLKNAVESL